MLIPFQFSQPMKLIYLFVLTLLIPIMGQGQQLSLLTGLDTTIKETSGLIYTNQRLITHNDSGGEAALYEIDINTGNTSRKVTISNATNVDWEDICFDSNYIYIGDIGNNSGTRTDLKVYKVSLSDYLTTTSNTVTAEVINYNYADQTSFTSSTVFTNFDAETLISFGDKLYIFTKNWGDSKTKIYSLSKTPGTYQISKIDSFDSQGLVTGGDYNSASNAILLTGYTFASPFIIEIKDFSATNFSGGTITRDVLQTPSGKSFQIESIAAININQYYLSAEESTTGSSGLYQLETSNPLEIDEFENGNTFMYPNPASNSISIETNYLSKTEIYDMRGVLRKSSSKKQINISDLSKGLYILKIKNTENNRVFIKKLIVN